jgi:ActR/RegA family two-component response regulator
MKVLIVEDGLEYSETLGRFLPELTWVRAGSGPEALERLSTEGFDAVFLDMRFDRVDDAVLLGDLAATADRFNGDAVQARAFLQDHQGLRILAALREAGHRLPALVSHDFGAEPRRWARIREAHGPVDYVDDVSGPDAVRQRLRALVSG